MGFALCDKYREDLGDSFHCWNLLNVSHCANVCIQCASQDVSYDLFQAATGRLGLISTGLPWFLVQTGKHLLALQGKWSWFNHFEVWLSTFARLCFRFQMSLWCWVFRWKAIESLRLTKILLL